MAYEGCLFCKHFKIDGSCAAFPTGIPLVIISGELEHTRVVKGQTGETVYEKRKARRAFDLVASQ